MAIGSTARGLVALGGRAVGVVSFGGVALGLVAFGGVGLGILGIGGLGAGVYALGGGAVGWRSAGGFAIGWDIACGGAAFARHAAVGGVAIARDYAVGGVARARHANDEAARAALRAHPFVRFVFTLIGQTEIRGLRSKAGVLLVRENDMAELAWLVGHRFQSLTRREFDWVIAFDNDVTLVIDCLWRLIEAGRVRCTGVDDGQQFGLPAPVDAVAEVNRRLAQAFVQAVELRQGTLDLEIEFSTGHFIQVIPDSSGYEAWNLTSGRTQFIAVGGGELAILGGPAAND